MKMPEGYVKIQLGLFYVVEVLVASDDPHPPDDGLDAVGYALFDLQHRQLSEVFSFFRDVLMAAEAMALV